MIEESSLNGKKYGRLTLTGINFLKQGKRQKRRSVQAICECGKIGFYDYDLVRRGTTRSCGCLKIDIARDRVLTHGLSEHPLYSVWLRLKEKCNNPNSKAHRNYGAKGVKLCEEWASSYMAFYNWATTNGWEHGLQIDKDKLYVEKFGGKIGLMYSPEYCCFLTQAENKKITSRTRYLEFNGIKKTASEWARTLGTKCGVLIHRLDIYGWDIEKSLATPIAKKINDRMVNAFGENKLVSEWLVDERCIVDNKILLKRLNRGWEAESALSSELGIKRNKKRLSV